MRDSIRKDVMRGRLVEPERVEERARKMMKGRKVKAPEDLDRILADWTYLVKHWNEKADELLIYKRFVAPEAEEVLEELPGVARLVGLLGDRPRDRDPAAHRGSRS